LVDAAAALVEVAQPVLRRREALAGGALVPDRRRPQVLGHRPAFGIDGRDFELGPRIARGGRAQQLLRTDAGGGISTCTGLSIVAWQRRDRRRQVRHLGGVRRRAAKALTAAGMSPAGTKPRAAPGSIEAVESVSIIGIWRGTSAAGGTRACSAIGVGVSAGVAHVERLGAAAHRRVVLHPLVDQVDGEEGERHHARAEQDRLAVPVEEALRLVGGSGLRRRAGCLARHVDRRLRRHRQYGRAASALGCQCAGLSLSPASLRVLAGFCFSAWALPLAAAPVPVRLGLGAA
jgi:hypothetical protein